jgi:PIN domain nuclease of toxin-antitoxin system
LLEDHYSMFTQVAIDSTIALDLMKVKAADIPDMPDRIIAATALHLDVPVISRDSKIRQSDIRTIW